jgi:copper(I)-binding protein
LPNHPALPALPPGRGLPATSVVAGIGAVLAAGLALIGCGGGGPAEPAAVTEAWAVPAGNGNSAAVYATITASGTDELTGARVDAQVARRAAIVNPADEQAGEPGHLGHLDPGGSLTDDHSHTVVLEPDTAIALEPGRAYLALDLLAEPLEPGTTFEITLTFDESPDVTTEVTVRDPL